MDITLTIVSVFLFISLVLGLLAGRGTNTFKKFAVGDKNFATRTLVATIVATNFGGGFLFRDLECIYTHGLYYALAPTLSFLGFFVMSHFMALRMGEFMKHFSIAESMGSLFGVPVRIITAISGILFLSGATAIQFQVISKIIKLCLNIEGNFPIYIAAIIILLYSAFGGIKAVTFTDIIQFIIFGTLIPTLLYLASSRIENYKLVTKILTTHQNFDLRQMVSFSPRFIDACFLTLIYFSPSFDPASMQRVYMAKDVWQVRSAFSYTAVIGTTIRVLVTFIAVILLASNANLNPKELVNYMLITHPLFWLKGFVCIGILALAMSTADSCIHTSSVLFVHDIAPYSKLQVNNKLFLAHLSSLIIGGLALWIAFIEQDLLKLLLLTLSFYKPIVAIPFFMAILGFRPSSKSVLLGIGAGALTVAAFKKGLGGYLGINNDVFPAMGMNLLFLMGSHYLLPKVPHTGWIGIKDKAPLMYEKQEKKGNKKQEE